MKLIDLFLSNRRILMEGAIGERLKNEFHISYDTEGVAMASLVNSKSGREALKHIYSEYISIAKNNNLPFMMMTPTRRANRERLSASGYDKGLIESNVGFLMELRDEFYSEAYIGGLMGCKGDAYCGSTQLSVEESFLFHKWQTDVFRDLAVDYLYAGIMPEIQEAVGMAKAMESSGLPYIISFMLRDDGCLMDGTHLDSAIRIIDDATLRQPLCYMSNCVHPTRLLSALEKQFNLTDIVKSRFKGVQVNSSPLSPEELECCDEVVSSSPIDLNADVKRLNEFIDVQILGGCCGTTKEHIEEFARNYCTKLGE